MDVIVARNPDDGLAQGLTLLRQHGLKEESRNGPVLVAPEPVTTVYRTPWERVSFDVARDANPFFHLMEALWMLAGRNDAEFPARFAKQIAVYSENGKLNGAYGHRWRAHFGYDQLGWIVDELGSNPASRRCVLSMWDGGSVGPEGAVEGSGDLYAALHGSKDVPCNTHVYFAARDGKLNMTVCNRSNDIVWGCYGANVVHMSMLQEVVAHFSGLEMGTYYQVSNNYHAYAEREDTQRLFTARIDRKTYGAVLPMFTASEKRTGSEALHLWLNYAERFVSGEVEYFTPFFEVCADMHNAHNLHKQGKTKKAIELLAINRDQWSRAGLFWLERRLAK